YGRGGGGGPLRCIPGGCRAPAFFKTGHEKAGGGPRVLRAGVGDRPGPDAQAVINPQTNSINQAADTVWTGCQAAVINLNRCCIDEYLITDDWTVTNLICHG